MLCGVRLPLALSKWSDPSLERARERGTEGGRERVGRSQATMEECYGGDIGPLANDFILFFCSRERFGVVVILSPSPGTMDKNRNKTSTRKQPLLTDWLL